MKLIILLLAEFNPNIGRSAASAFVDGALNRASGNWNRNLRDCASLDPHTKKARALSPTPQSRQHPPGFLSGVVPVALAFLASDARPACSGCGALGAAASSNCRRDGQQAKQAAAQ